MRIKLDEGAFPPSRAHDRDAGIDLRSKHSQRVMPHGSAIFRTGVHVELPEGTCGVVKAKSGLMTKHKIITTGLVDEPYRGEVVVMLFNHGEDSYLVEAGDKIANFVVVPVRYEPLEFVEELDMNTDRGTSGFGSTGR